MSTKIGFRRAPLPLGIQENFQSQSSYDGRTNASSSTSASFSTVVSGDTNARTSSLFAENALPSWLAETGVINGTAFNPINTENSESKRSIGANSTLLNNAHFDETASIASSPSDDASGDKHSVAAGVSGVLDARRLREAHVSFFF